MRGRKEKYINHKKVEEYIRIGLSGREIAKLTNVSEFTIRAKFHALLQKREHENILVLNEKKKKLLDKQFERAMEGSDIMLIWLGKNWLKQSDKIEQNGKHQLTIIKILMLKTIDIAIQNQQFVAIRILIFRFYLKIFSLLLLHLL